MGPGGQCDIEPAVHQEPGRHGGGSGDTITHEFIEFGVRQILFTNLDPVHAGSGGALDKVNDAALELSPVSDGVEEHGSKVRIIALGRSAMSVPAAFRIQRSVKCTALCIYRSSRISTC